MWMIAIMLAAVAVPAIAMIALGPISRDWPPGRLMLVSSALLPLMVFVPAVGLDIWLLIPPAPPQSDLPRMGGFSIVALLLGAFLFIIGMAVSSVIDFLKYGPEMDADD